MIVFIIIGILIVITITLSYVCYKMIYFNNLKVQELYKLPIKINDDQTYQKVCQMIDDVKKEPYEKVSIKGYDGLILNARYYHSSDNAPLEIVFHGYKSINYRDFCGGFKVAKKLGHNILLIEQRGHGDSKSNKITFGVKEKKDCVSWCKYALDKFGNNIDIILVGISMGAATVLMASELDLPQNVKGIIADCPYSSPKDIILKVCKDMKIPVFLAYPFIAIGTILFTNIRFNSKGAKDAVKNTDIPILLIHGTSDDFVPSQMSRMIYENAKPYKELHLFEGAGHGASFLVDENKYNCAVINYCNKILNKAKL